MNLYDAVGQMLLYGWSGDDSLTVNEHAVALLQEMRVGGVILFTRNVAHKDQLQENLQILSKMASELSLPPLFVAIDQEGGRVARLMPPHFAATRAAREIGKSEDPDEARAAAASIGKELIGIGINFNFAPVLDVDNNPNNPVIGDRSYSRDPAIVSLLGEAAIRGFQDDAGVMACGKHFPGHGDTETDSHHALPRISQPESRLRAVELPPFQAAINAGAAAIMSAHILFDDLDPSLPATLSPRILTQLLREEMRYDGLIVTDCLEMKGVSARWGSPEAAVLAVIAGADILLCCHTLETQRLIRAALLQAVKDGRILEERIQQSAERISAAKKKWLAGTT